MLLRTFVPLALVLGVACVPQAPAAPTPHNAVEVSASFGKTWDALIDQFADRNIPIKTIERASGLIATDPLRVGESLLDAADCGKDWTGTKVYPTNVVYNALVRGDSSHSTIRITARWSRIGASREMGTHGDVNEECSSRAAWETEIENAVKTVAESRK